MIFIVLLAMKVQNDAKFNYMCILGVDFSLAFVAVENVLVDNAKNWAQLLII